MEKNILPNIESFPESRHKSLEVKKKKKTVLIWGIKVDVQLNGARAGGWDKIWLGKKWHLLLFK